MIHQRAPDGMHQMRFSQPHSAVDKQRIVGARRIRHHRLRRGVRELIAGAHHEGVESELRIQGDGRREQSLRFFIQQRSCCRSAWQAP